ncbi:hypothetical protein AVEN_82284-1, partial [Araneus ventricosus]
SISNIDDGTYRCPDGSSPAIRHKRISGVLGAASSVTSIQVANLLRLFKIPQFLCLSAVQQQITCGDPTILPYELIHSRNRFTVVHNVRLSRAWQVLDVYASRLITLTPPESIAPCETLLSEHIFHPAINL